MENSHYKNLSVLILASLFISTSGALGKFIDLPTPVIILGRSFVGMLATFIYCKFQGVQIIRLAKNERFRFFLSALFLGAHWITYFYALKASNVAIGMLSLFTFPALTALLEPLFGKEKFKPIHIVLGCMILLGIYILAPDLDFDNSHVKGILFGLLSALFYSLRNLILKQYTNKYNGSMLMLFQLVILSIVLIPVVFTFDVSGIKTQYQYVILLGVLTTAIGHTLFVKSLKHFSAATASIISSIQPIFGIIIAFFFLSEIPNLNTFFGGLLILTTVVIESKMARK
ncbi:MAG: EamA family transporter [Flavobacteriaceae bacterium]|nr:MAG: EamA family transporter [Flavobacteriaceae bacterium]